LADGDGSVAAEGGFYANLDKIKYGVHYTRNYIVCMATLRRVGDVYSSTDHRQKGKYL